MSQTSQANAATPRNSFTGRTIHPVVIPILCLISLQVIYFWVWLYRRYDEINRADPEATKVPPGKALGFLFIPFFNIYWGFYIWYDFARALRRLQVARAGRTVLWPYAIPIVMWGAIVGELLSAILIAALGGPSPLASPLAALLYFGDFPLQWGAMMLAQISLNYVWNRTAAPAAMARSEDPSLARRFYRRQFLAATACLVPIFLGVLFLGYEAVQVREMARARAIRLGLAFTDAARSPASDSDTEKAIARLSMRLKVLGVPSPQVLRGSLPGEAIEVALPVVGEFDRSRIIDVLLFQGLLELKEVIAGPFPDEPQARAALGSASPDEAVIMPGAAQPKEYYVCKKLPVLTGEGVQRATPGRDYNDARPNVHVRLTEQGGEQLRAYSRAHIGKQLGIVLDGKLLEAPTIQGELARDVQITGQFTTAQAEDLATILRAGAMPCFMQLLSEQEISARRWLVRQIGIACITALGFAVMVGLFIRIIPREYAPA